MDGHIPRLQQYTTDRSMSNFKKIISNGFCLRTLNGPGMQKNGPRTCIQGGNNQKYVFGNALFCFRSNNKQTKSKRFSFVPIISGPNQNVLFRSISFWIIQKRSFLPKTISRPNQIALLCTKIFRPKWKQFACDKNIFGPNQNVLLLFR